MSAGTLSDILFPPQRPAAPEPTLLPWLAQWADPADLPRIARAAAGLAATVDPGWPPIAEAVAEVLARRIRDPGQLDVLVATLPPLAGLPTSGPVTGPDAQPEPPETLVYRALGGRALPGALRSSPASGADRTPGRAGGVPLDSAWGRLRSLAEAAPPDIPPLANVSLLADLLTGRAEQPGALRAGEATYLLPYLDPRTDLRQDRVRQALDLVEAALHEESDWYAAALATRAAPYLAEEQRQHLLAIADAMAVDPWNDHLRALALTARLPWPSASAETAAAHPAVPALDHAVATTDPLAVAELCQEAVESVITHHTGGAGWQTPPDDWWTGQPTGMLADRPGAEAQPTPATPADAAPRQVPMAAIEPVAEPARYVNAHIVLPDEPANPVHRYRPLRPATRYAVRVGIGPAEVDSLIDNPAPFPDFLLPQSPEGHWLDVTAASSDLQVDRVPAALFLPRHGAAWACRCPPGSNPHRCHWYDRIPYVLLGLRSADTPGTGRMRVTIHHQGHLLRSFRISVETGTDPMRVLSSPALLATEDYTDSADFNDVGTRSPRGLSVVTDEPDDGTFWIRWGTDTTGELRVIASEAQLGNAMRDFREALFSAHLEVISRRSAHAPHNPEGQQDYRADLAHLAHLGRTLHRALRGMVDPALPAPTDQPCTIQIARVRNSAYVFPWAAVYDLPLNDPRPEVDADAYADAADWYRPCPVLGSWRQDVVEGGYPYACPHRAEHGLDTLCPYGFWGFRYVIEVPPSARPRTPLRQEIPYGDTAGLVIGHSLSKRLDLAAVSAHLTSLAARLPGFTVQHCPSAVDLGNALARPDLQLIYFLCHGLHGSRHGAHVGPVVEIGECDEISTHQIAVWNEHLWVNQPEHWSAVAPLVIINGCHTAAISPEALVSFVDAFSQAGSAGVIGTEVMLNQSLAAEAAELFIGHFADPDGVDVGEAIRRMRLDLLADGNVTGLAYTPYCSAELRLRRAPAARSESAAEVPAGSARPWPVDRASAGSAQ